MKSYEDIIATVEQKLFEKQEAGIIKITTRGYDYQTNQVGLNILESPHNPIPYDSINNFYRNFGRVNIEWKLSDEFWKKMEDEMEVLVTGMIHINPFQQMISPRIRNGEDSYRFEEMKIEGGENIPIPKDLRYYTVSILDEEGRGSLGFFVGEGYDDKLWHMDLYNNFECTGMTIDRYFESFAKDFGVNDTHTYYDDDYFDLIFG